MFPIYMLFVELLSGVLTNAQSSVDVNSFHNDFKNAGNNCHFFMAIDISKILEMDVYYDQIESLISNIKASGTQNQKDENRTGKINLFQL